MSEPLYFINYPVTGGVQWYGLVNRETQRTVATWSTELPVDPEHQAKKLLALLNGEQ